MRICQLTGKRTMHGHNVSHSKRRTNRIWKPNLQTKIIEIDGVSIKIRACAKYIKRMNKKV
jgi:large subunit ribosomal protein L28